MIFLKNEVLAASLFFATQMYGSGLWLVLLPSAVLQPRELLLQIQPTCKIMLSSVGHL